MNTDYMDYTDSLLSPPLAPPTQEGKLPLWEAWKSTESVFCRAVVKCGYLKEEQMLRAAERYRLGRSRDGGVIFWQIDEEGRTRDGKIMYYREDCHRDKSRHPSWASARLKAYYGYDGDLPVERCLFGLHLLSQSHFKGHTDLTDDTDFLCAGAAFMLQESVESVRSVCHKKSVCVVEAEKTAVICSELFPQSIWMAAGGLSALSAEKLRPLRDHKVVLFPDTDPDGTTYACWKAIAREASRSFFSPIYVSPLLERHATPEQKAAKIDLVDFLFEPQITQISQTI